MNRTLIKNKNGYYTIFALFLMLAFALSSAYYTKVTLDGLTLWALYIAPSVFFYFVLSSILSSLGYISKISMSLTPVARRIFNCNGTAFYALFMGLIAGYPTGTKITAQLYSDGLINYDEARRISGLSSVSGILFIISTIGGMVGINSAVAILISHIFSVFLTSMFFRGKRAYTPPRTPLKATRMDNIIYNSIYNSVISVLVLGGIITAFYVLTEILTDFKLLFPIEEFFNFFLRDNDVSHALICGFFECIKGIKMLSVSTHKLRIPLIGFILSFGGFSVITQSVIFLKKAKIKTAVFLCSKVLHAVFCFVILYILTLIKVI